MLTILFHHASFLFFLIIDLYLLIPAAIAQIFNAIAEPVIPIGIPSKEAKAEIEMHPLSVKLKWGCIQYNLELYKPFWAFYVSVLFALFFQRNNFLFHVYF